MSQIKGKQIASGSLPLDRIDNATTMAGNLDMGGFSVVNVDSVDSQGADTLSIRTINQTDPATSSASLLIKSGDAADGDSGGITIETGSATGGRGSVVVDAETLQIHHQTNVNIITLTPQGSLSGPEIRCTDSMNINVENFSGALGFQAGGVDLVLVGGDDGGGESYLQSQNGVRIESRGRFVITDYDGAHTATIYAQDAIAAASPLNLSMTELQINGSAGSAGQVLQSGGSGTSPVWITPTEAKQSARVKLDVPVVPADPAPPTFSGTVHTATSEAELDSALSAAVDGDIIEIAAGTTITLTTAKVINKSIELRGVNRTTSILSATGIGSDSIISISGTNGLGEQNNNVYLHDFTIQDVGAVYSVINAKTYSTQYPLGSSNLYFENLTINGTGAVILELQCMNFVVKGCIFTSTVNLVWVYGFSETSYVIANDFLPRELAPGVYSLVTAVYLTSTLSGAGELNVGFAGGLVFKNNTNTVGPLSSLLSIVTERCYRALGGEILRNIIPHNFSLWLIGNSCNETSGLSSGAITITPPTGSTERPLDFFDLIYTDGNSISKPNDPSKNFGIISVTANTFVGDAGKPARLCVVNANTGSAMTNALTGSYVQGCEDDDGTGLTPAQGNLLAIDTDYFNSPSPSNRVPLCLYQPSDLGTIDGVSVASGDRVLVVADDPIDSGIYTAGVGAWTRSADMASGISAAASSIVVQEGEIYADTQWLCTSDKGSDVVGTDSLNFAQIDKPYTAGTGLTLLENKFYIGANGITELMLADSSVATASIQNSAVTQSKLSLTSPVNPLDAATKNYVDTAVSNVLSVEYDQQIFVAAGANPAIATGSVLKPFATITAALAAITDATPTKRYAIRVSAGSYTEPGAISLKPNVFIVGTEKNAVRITATSWALDASFSGGSDHRSGLSNVILPSGACNFNWNTVGSTAGKLYFDSVVFVAAVTLTGTNNAIPQAQFSNCQMYAALTVQGINVGVFNDNILFSNIVLTQSPFGGVPTILTATGGACSGTVTATTTVNDFYRRISIFARSFWMNGTITIDGPSTYLDYTTDSVPSSGITTANGGNLVRIDGLSAIQSVIRPKDSSAINCGDWGQQWLYAFNYVNVSTGTDLYIGTVDSSYDASGSVTGYSVYLQSDQFGVRNNVNGGVLDMRTANTTGTGISGKIEIATGTSANGNSGDINLTTGTTSGTGTRGVVNIESRILDLKLVDELKLNGAAGTSGQVLTSQGAGSAPIWSNITPTPGLGNVLIVDAVNGNDGTGAVNGAAFLTVEGAISCINTNSLQKVTIWVMPGTYNLAAGITIPNTCAIRGLNTQTVVLQRLGVTSNTTLVTMGENTRIEDLQLKLTSSTAVNLTGIRFSGTTATTAKVRTCVVTVDNSGVSTGSSTEVYGVLVDGSGSLSNSTFSFNCLKGSTVNVLSNGAGLKAGICIPSGTTSPMSTRDMNFYVAEPSDTASTGTYVGIHCDSATGQAQLRTSSLFGPAYKGVETNTAVRVLTISNVASLSGPQTIQGVSLIAGDRILLTGQTVGTANGIYVVAAGAWARAADMAVASNANGAWVPVTEGTYAGESWLCVSTPAVVGTDATVWTHSYCGADVKVPVKARYTGGAPTGALAAQGSYTPQNGDRIFLDTATSAVDNGIWVYNSAGAWTRSADMTTGAQSVNSYLIVLGGTDIDKAYFCTTTGTVGTTALTFVQKYIGADVHQDAPVSSSSSYGINVGAGTDLVRRSAGGKPFNVYTVPHVLYYSLRGNVSTGTRYLWQGVQTNDDTTQHFYRFQQSAIVQGLYVNFRTAPSSQTVTINILKSQSGLSGSGVATSLTVSLTGNTTQVENYTASVDFEEGTYLAVEIVSDGIVNNADMTVEIDAF